MGRSGIGWTEIGWKGIGWAGVGWSGMGWGGAGSCWGWDRVGWDRVGWDRVGCSFALVHPAPNDGIARDHGIACELELPYAAAIPQDLSSGRAMISLPRLWTRHGILAPMPSRLGWPSACRPTYAVGSVRWGLCGGVFAVGSLWLGSVRWGLCGGVFAVGSLRWGLCGGVCVVGSLR